MPACGRGQPGQGTRYWVEDCREDGGGETEIKKGRNVPPPFIAI